MAESFFFLSQLATGRNGWENDSAAVMDHSKMNAMCQLGNMLRCSIGTSGVKNVS